MRTKCNAHSKFRKLQVGQLGVNNAVVEGYMNVVWNKLSKIGEMMAGLEPFVRGKSQNSKENLTQYQQQENPKWEAEKKKNVS